MNPDYWISRWERDETGFHAPEVQAGLIAAFDQTGFKQPGNVLVPLCGKSVDMVWLASRGWRVFGVELSEKACRAFFDEQHIPYTVEEKNGFRIFESERITLFCGDMFHLKKGMLPAIDLVFDRAALVALPHAIRKRYVSFLQRIAGSCVHILITFEYSHEEIIGPPFSVPETELEALYGAGFDRRIADSRALITYEGSKMRRHGVKELSEKTFILVPSPKIP
jgi:thiopurine S-methyltransferase